MRTPTWAAALVVGLLVAGCARQSTIESTGDVAVSTTPVDARSLPSGTNIDVTIDQEIGTKSSKVGDTFTATVTTPIVATNGVTAVPAGSKIQGKITGLDTSDKLGDQAAIRVDFDRIVVNGTSYPFYGKVTATNLDTRGESREETIRKAGVGAAAGAVLGAIVSGGDLDKILLGGVLGAAAGTVISLGMGDVEGVLPAGTTLKLQTTRTVALR